ncbi:MAG: sigma 54-interacting transcriptional regulator, partial [Candidatus Adiutrix sp.]|jgi:DNA-binding NtrC family response regulator|nr:sigma 54-interacting transcriptional regulator [Candidatus Adiutrix sp.]
VAINCGGMPENLVESELFGHKKGSFTGATSDKQGLVAIADGGTLFLDELGELSLTMQVKLLRVLQEKTFRPVGGERELTSDVRFISATNRNLETEIMAGRFREDLYYRINVINIHLPPLRERTTDIHLLAHFFLEKYSKLQNKDVRKLSAYALDILSRYHFPGNVRELENIIERSVALEQSSIILPESLRLADFKRDNLPVWGFSDGPGAPPPLPSAGPLFYPAGPAPPASSASPAAPPYAASASYSALSPESSNLAVSDMRKVMREAMTAVLPGLPAGGIDELLATLESYYIYRAMFMTGGLRGRAADLLTISPFRLRARLGSCELSDLSPSALAKIEPEKFPKPELPEGLAPDWSPEGLDLDETLHAVERHFIHEALTGSAGNKTEAASLLGLSRRSFQHRLERTGYERQGHGS